MRQPALAHLLGDRLVTPVGHQPPDHAQVAAVASFPALLDAVTDTLA
jgi:hypothetical protein